jgi:hypothetical protein
MTPDANLVYWILGLKIRSLECPIEIAIHRLAHSVSKGVIAKT